MHCATDTCTSGTTCSQCNSGYTGSGTPKLLDLSLAAVLVPTWGEDDRRSDPVCVAEVHGEYAVMSDSRRFGTLRYMSPEALAGCSPAPSFDVWALGVVLYEVLAGRHPLSHLTDGALVAGLQQAAFADVREVCHECPAEVARFFQDALSVDPDRRPRTAAAFRARLQSLLAGLPAAAR